MHTLNTIRHFLKKEHGIEVDFRTDKHTANPYGLGGVICRDRARRIVSFTLQHLNRDCSGQNVPMILQELQVKTLKTWMSGIAYQSNN